MPIRAPVRLPGPGGVLGKNLLAAVRAVPAATAVRVAADVAVHVPHVVAVLLVEGVVGDLAEARPPEDEALLKVEPDALEEERVLQPAVVLEVGVAAEGAVQVRHAHGEVFLGQVVDVAGCDLGARDGRAGAVIARVGRDEVLGKVVEDRGEAVVFVEAREGASGELDSLSAPAIHEYPELSGLTSNARSNRAVNSFSTILCCSLPGTYAFPPFTNTFLPSTKSGTLVQSTLHHSSSITCPTPPLFPPNPTVAANWPANSLLSSSPTCSHARFNVRTNAARSRESSAWNRRRNNMVSTRAKRRRRSSVDANASRKMKWL